MVGRRAGNAHHGMPSLVSIEHRDQACITVLFSCDSIQHPGVAFTHTHTATILTHGRLYCQGAAWASEERAKVVMLRRFPFLYTMLR